MCFACAGLTEEDAQAMVNPASQASTAYESSSQLWPALGDAQPGNADAAWDDDDDDGRDQNGDHDFLGAAALQNDCENGSTAQRSDDKAAEPVGLRNSAFCSDVLTSCVLLLVWIVLTSSGPFCKCIAKQ